MSAESPRYEGPQKNGNGVVIAHLWTDPLTGSTFSTTDYDWAQAYGKQREVWAMFQADLKTRRCAK